MSDAIDPKFLPLKVFETLPHCQAIGLKLIAVDETAAVMRLDWDERFIGNPETKAVHGGLITTVMDTVGGVAAIAAVNFEQMVATLDLRIDYMKPTQPDRAILGRAECYKLSRYVAFVRGTAYQEGTEDDPVAAITATYMLTGREAKPDQELGQNMGAGDA